MSTSVYADLNSCNFITPNAQRLSERTVLQRLFQVSVIFRHTHGDLQVRN
jgi:hypothetical protein